MKTKALLLVAGLALIGGAAFLLYQNKNTVDDDLALPPDVVTSADIQNIPSPTEVKTVSSDSEDYDPSPEVYFNHTIVKNGDTNSYSNTELGIAFEYPSNWGNRVTYGAEKSACPKESKDPCLQVITFIWNGDEEKEFFVIATPAHDEYYVPGRGWHWGDSASIPIFRPFGTQCEKFPDECNIITNKHGIEYIVRFQKAPAPYENYPRWIILFSLPNEYYKGMAISLEDPTNPETAESTTEVKSSLIKIAESVRVVK